MELQRRLRNHLLYFKVEGGKEEREGKRKRREGGGREEGGRWGGRGGQFGNRSNRSSDLGCLMSRLLPRVVSVLTS